MRRDRPEKDDYFMTLAWAVGRRGTCVRKPYGIGCVLVNGLGHVVGSGYNGRPAGYEHCNHVVEKVLPEGATVKDGETFRVISQKCVIDTFPYACKGAFAPAGTKPDTCEAVHAEVNALNQCYDRMWIDTCYVIHSPCAATCLKQLMNTSCRRIVFALESSDTERAKEMWLRNNGKKVNPLVPQFRVWEHFPLPNPFQGQR